MRTTLNIDERMLAEASELTGVKEKTALVSMELESLIARESARKLAKLGGTEPQLTPIRRRKLTSCLLNGCLLWTRDKPLMKATKHFQSADNE